MFLFCGGSICHWCSYGIFKKICLIKFFMWLRIINLLRRISLFADSTSFHISSSPCRTRFESFSTNENTKGNKKYLARYSHEIQQITSNIKGGPGDQLNILDIIWHCCTPCHIIACRCQPTQIPPNRRCCKRSSHINHNSVIGPLIAWLAKAFSYQVIL